LGTIRFLLAMAVVCAHVGKLPYTVQLGSLLAVQAFYIISGFLIALVWTNKYELRSNGLFLFYSNRAARIYILYWIVLVISIVVALVTKWLTHDYPGYFGSRPRELLLYTIFINTWIFGSSWAYWLGFDGSIYFTTDYTSSPYPVWGTMILSPAWTLDLELSFYLLAPFLVNLRLRYILAIIAASLVARFSWYGMGHDVDPWNYRFFPFEIGLFILGVAAYGFQVWWHGSQVQWFSKRCSRPSSDRYLDTACSAFPTVRSIRSYICSSSLRFCRTSSI
jgi:peptidoglycan/LPS O-acetylase OafA/YrhL